MCTSRVSICECFFCLKKITRQRRACNRYFFSRTHRSSGANVIVFHPATVFFSPFIHSVWIFRYIKHLGRVMSRVVFQDGFHLHTKYLNFSHVERATLRSVHDVNILRANNFDGKTFGATRLPNPKTFRKQSHPFYGQQRWHDDLSKTVGTNVKCFWSNVVKTNVLSKKLI